VAAPVVARAHAATTLLSGPAAAPTAGLAYAARLGVRDFLTVDMGGTSFDVCLVKDGAAAMTTEGRIARYPFGLPSLAIHTMGAGIRHVTVERGHDPREFLLVVGGGAGPVHAAGIARELDLTRILVPRNSSLFCATGLLLSDLRHDVVRSFVVPLERVDRDRL